uniref:Uncharacterized protein n=1 Tax=Arundo donax TaxID=35708 RepID=A0A0A9A3W7_ARUDO
MTTDTYDLLHVPQ